MKRSGIFSIASAVLFCQQSSPTSLEALEGLQRQNDELRLQMGSRDEQLEKLRRQQQSARDELDSRAQWVCTCARRLAGRGKGMVWVAQQHALGRVTEAFKGMASVASLRPSLCYIFFIVLCFLWYGVL